MAQTNQPGNDPSQGDSQKGAFPEKLASLSGGKERETVPVSSQEIIQPITAEVILTPELDQTGVEIQGETIELPPDMKKIGLVPSGSAVPVSTPAASQVILPLSDKKIIAGLHMPVSHAFAWFAVWCLRKLKKAHFALRIIHGRIVRVRE